MTRSTFAFGPAVKAVFFCEHELRALLPAHELERAAGDVDRAAPEVVEVLTRDLVGRHRRGRDESIPGGVRLTLLPHDRDVLAGRVDRLDVLPTLPRRDVEVRVHDRGVRRLEVGTGELAAVAPLRGLLVAERDRQRIRLDDLRRGLDQVRSELRVLVVDARACENRVHRKSGRVRVALRDVRVERHRLLVMADDNCPRRGGIWLRRRGRADDKARDERCRAHHEQNRPFTHVFPPSELALLGLDHARSGVTHATRFPTHAAALLRSRVAGNPCLRHGQSAGSYCVTFLGQFR